MTIEVSRFQPSFSGRLDTQHSAEAQQRRLIPPSSSIVADDQYPYLQKPAFKLCSYPFLVVFALTLLLGYLPDVVPSRKLLVSSFDNVFRPLRLLVIVFDVEVVLIREYNSVEVRQEPLGDPEIAFQSSRLFVGIEGSSFSDHINL